MKYEPSDFYCMKCGRKGLPVQRPEAKKREAFHRKKLYCYNCKTEVNHIECKNQFEVEEFKINFTEGIYLQEVKESLEVCKNG